MSIFAKYSFMDNQFDTNASYDGCMFETFGEELAFVREMWEKSPKRVWTISQTSNEKGEDLILFSNEMWLSDRIGYLISLTPGDEGEEFIENLEDHL